MLRAICLIALISFGLQFSDAVVAQGTLAPTLQISLPSEPSLNAATKGKTFEFVQEKSLEVWSHHTFAPTLQIPPLSDSDLNAASKGKTFEFVRRPKIEVLTETIKTAPDDIENYLARADYLDDVGNYHDAAADYHEVLRRDPGSIRALECVSYCYGQTGDFENALKYISRAVKIAPEPATSLTIRAAIHGERNDLEKALVDIERAIQLDPKLTSAYWGRAVLLSATGQIKRALSDLTIVIDSDAEHLHEKARCSRVNLLQSSGHHLEALSDLNELVRMNPTNSEYYEMRSVSLARFGRFAEALDDADTLIELEPDRAGSYNVRASAYIFAGRYARGVTDYREALKRDPDNLIAIQNLAHIHAKSEDDAIRDPALAIKYATHACSITGWKDAVHLGNLANAYASGGDFASAEKWLRVVTEIGDADQISKCTKFVEQQKARRP